MHIALSSYTTRLCWVLFGHNEISFLGRKVLPLGSGILPTTGDCIAGFARNKTSSKSKQKSKKCFIAAFSVVWGLHFGHSHQKSTVTELG